MAGKDLKDLNEELGENKIFFAEFVPVKKLPAGCCLCPVPNHPPVKLCEPEKKDSPGFGGIS